MTDDDDDDDDDNDDNDDPAPLFEQIVDPGGVQGGRHLRLTLLSRKLQQSPPFMLTCMSALCMIFHCYLMTLLIMTGTSVCTRPR